MAPIKRKDGPTNESFVREKKQRRDESGAVSAAIRNPAKTTFGEEEKPATAPSKFTAVPKITKGRDEEQAFPRGGASVLTPLEHKQIQIEATRDVLFEQAHAKTREADADDSGAPSAKKPKARGKKGKKSAEPAPEEEDKIVIEGLNYKRLVTGSLVLGQVSQINAHDIAIALPNNLTGYVPITSISEKVTERIEKLVAEEEDSSDEADEAEDVDLKGMFTIGQYLRAYVVSTSDDSKDAAATKGKRRIELSLNPRQSNTGLTTNEVVVNSMVMASVISVEDHGLIMDIGLQESGVKGFMSSKEVGYGVNVSAIQEGSVFLCMVTGFASNGKTIKLAADVQKIGNTKKGNYLVEAPTVDAFLPGSAVEILVLDTTTKGIHGKVMGMVDVTADLMHSGAGTSGKDVEKKYKIGSKVKGRVICTFPTFEPKKLGISLLEHVMQMVPQQTLQTGQKQDPLEILPLSTILESVTVRKVEPGIGLFVDIGVKGVSGFVHISRITDGKIETLSETTGPFKIDSAHRGRVIGYNSMDGVYLVSLEPKVLEQAFLRVEDLKVGEVVKGKVEKLIVNDRGVGGVLVNLAEGITGLVPEAHLADVQLLHPEKKFKEGMKVTARVLSTDPSKRQIRLTLKKTLVNSEATPFKDYAEITPGMQSPGTIINLMPSGAVVQFYGTIRGFLPVSEMSEAFIKDPSQHFRVGQVVNVHVLTVDAEAGKLSVSCKDPSAFGLAQQNALKKLQIGQIVSGSVMQKSNDDISIELDGGLKAVLPLGHLTDGSEQRNLVAMKKIRVGQSLTDLVVLDKLEQKRAITLTNKPSFLQAAKSHTLIRSLDDVREQKIVYGFVKNITLTAVFVQFAAGMNGLVPKNQLSEATIRLPDFGLKRFQSVTCKVLSVDHGQQRFLLSMKDLEQKKEVTSEPVASTATNVDAINPVDDSIKSVDDLTLGKLTKARIASVKDTQINVQLADNIQGRIDVSQLFDNWEDIKDRKHPLRNFAAKQIIDVRVLGIHDARNHRFLPISHRTGKTMVFELSAKLSDQTEKVYKPLTINKVKVDSQWIAYVNNVGDNCLWVNLSPNVRGRIAALDVSDDVSLLTDLESNFPVGSAIKARVTGVDVANNRLDLSARSAKSSEPLTIINVTKGMVVPGKVTKVNERQLMVQLSDSLSAPVHLTDLTDDYDVADPSVHSKNDIIRVCVTDVDMPNKKLRLSTRPSRVLNSSLPVKDPEITSISQIKVNDVIRGFVKNVADNGLFVNLGGNVTAYVRVSDLSDSFVKEWKTKFQVDQLVKGKVIMADADLNHLQLSLKDSVIDKNYVAPITFNDLKVGQIVTGKVRKVEDFGVFIVVDGSANVSGLAHRSEMAEKRVEDVKKLYEEGDDVKAIVLKLDADHRRINFGLKASYFENDEEASESSDEEMSGMEGVELGEDSEEDEEDDDEEDGGIELDELSDASGEDEDEEMSDAPVTSAPALSAGGFDWNADNLDEADDQSDAGSNAGEEEKPKKKKKKSEIKVDRTGDLDANGPQSTSDFERLLLGSPDSSSLWIQYMAFQMKLSELTKAREVAERAIRTINIREETEKLNVWIALLNLENAYGSDETVDEVFKRACQFNDAQEIHERLTSIYIQSGKHQKADALFQVLVKKFSQSPDVWYNYAQFLMTTMSAPDRARALLPRAIQSLPTHTHLALTIKFGALEFHSPSGSAERGRTIFEGLLSTFPKRLDIWNQLLDLEIKEGDDEIIRGVFERVTKVKGLKIKGAKAWFKRWSEWEEKNGDKKSLEKVRAKAEEWVRTVAQKE